MSRVYFERLWRLKKDMVEIEKKLCAIEAKEKTRNQHGNSILHSLSVPRKIDDLQSEKQSLLQELMEKQQTFLEVRVELEKQICKVDDQYVRLAMSLHYVDLLTWKQAAYIIGGNCTDRALQQLIARYMRSEEKEVSMSFDTS